jgi:hypothetical protein
LETANVGLSKGIKLVQTSDELILKNIPYSSPPIDALVSVFDLPKRFLNAIFAWLFELIPIVII